MLDDIRRLERRRRVWATPEHDERRRDGKQPFHSFA
jgi:hypothetical protein